MKIPKDMDEARVKELIETIWDAAHQLSIKTGLVVQLRYKNEDGATIYSYNHYQPAECVFLVGDKEFKSLKDARRAIQQKAFL